MKAMMQDSKVLVIDNLSIEFGGLKAVSNFSMEMHKKELIGLIGPMVQVRRRYLI